MPWVDGVPLPMLEKDRASLFLLRYTWEYDLMDAFSLMEEFSLFKHDRFTSLKRCICSDGFLLA